MKIRKVAIASVAAAAATLGLATPAFAINRVSCATVGGQYLSFYPSSASDGQCFANAGTMSVHIPDLKALEAGNNSGWFRYEYQDGKRYTSTFRHGDRRTGIQGIKYVYEVTIS